MNITQSKPVSGTILKYLESVNTAVNKITDPATGEAVQIPNYEVLQRAARGLDESSYPSQTALIIQRLLGRGASFDMETAGPEQPLSFPKDHHLHPKMGPEWHYLSCDLNTKGPNGESQRIGVMIWLQKNRIVGTTAQTEANWSDEESLICASKVTVVMKTDNGKGRLIRRNRNLQWPLKGGHIAYSKPGENFRFVCGPDSFSGSKNVLPLRAQVNDGDRMRLDLVADCQDALTPETAFFLRGVNGCGFTELPAPGFEYGWPQIKVSGTVMVEGKTYQVESGLGWIDHQNLNGSLENPPQQTPGYDSIPFVDDGQPFLGWCWMYLNLANKDTLMTIGLNVGPNPIGLSPQLPIISTSSYYTSIKEGKLDVTILSNPEKPPLVGEMKITNFQVLPTITNASGPYPPNALIPNGWTLTNVKDHSWAHALAGNVTAWSDDATFNAEDWSLASEMPVDFTDTSGQFANGTGYAEVIGYENSFSFQQRALVFLETGVLPGAIPEVSLAATKPILVKLGKKPRSHITQLRENFDGPIMDKISDILKGLEAEGKVEDDTQIVIAMVK
ncbi:hypothetical protein DXZ20_19635 [Leptolyngbyaceae cyanobacterium CCMR0081]|uniref:AttH domain-containing protein n=1 Tax=Adonisia turfae CCMR0081 TaxID=2292702 RepID=A0A6M0RNS1_9CYAN|nr:hypothetical protein [Adonisia turfae CCMR0081]